MIIIVILLLVVIITIIIQYNLNEKYIYYIIMSSLNIEVCDVIYHKLYYNSIDKTISVLLLLLLPFFSV
jgi:uncharacterized membrane protein